MVRRIALFLSIFSMVSGFTVPQLPTTNRGVYRLDNVIAAAVRTHDGGVFPLTVGFGKDFVPSAASHRDRAQYLLDSIERGLAEEDLSGVDISVARVYSTTREVGLTVAVDDVSRMDSIRTRLIRVLSRIPGVVFAGESGQVRIE